MKNLMTVAALAWIMWVQHPDGSWTPIGGYLTQPACAAQLETAIAQHNTLDVACFPASFDPRP